MDRSFHVSKLAVGSDYLLQVHVLGQLLLQHVLQLLVHLSQVFIPWFHQISEDRTQTSSVSLRGAVTSDCTARHI